MKRWLASAPFSADAAPSGTAAGMWREAGARDTEATTLGQEGPWSLATLALAPVVVAVGYLLGSLLGLSLPFPSTQISVFWAPNAILLAALLITPRARWWTYLVTVLPVHLVVQTLMGIPFPAVLINFVGNVGDALLGAVAIGYFISRRERLDRLQAVVLIMFFGGIVAPALMSSVVAELFVRSGLSADPWLEWRLRLLTNALAVLTLVPPLVLSWRKPLSKTAAPPARRSGEAGALVIGLVVSGILLFGLPEASAGQSPIFLYTPLAFLLWAAMRFGLLGACTSVLILSALSIWGALHGHGPFTAHQPVENATSLVLFLDVTCAPLLMLAALLEDRESLDAERRQLAALHGAVLTSMHDQIAVLDRDGLIREVNESWTAAGRAGPGANYLDVLRVLTEPGLEKGSAKTRAGIAEVLSGSRGRFQMELPGASSPAAWFELSAEGLKRPEGGAVITFTDTTGRKQAELEARQQRQELAHLTRVAMLGELSGTLAHEINQPLTAILSNAQAAQRLLAREPVDLQELREILRDIADDDRRAGEVIRRLRAMLRKGEAKVVPLDFNEVARETLALAHGDLIMRNVSVTTELAPWLPRVSGDRVQLQQVLLNLIVNGCEAMSGNQPDERQLTLVTAREQGRKVRVAVVDCGTGIPADELERVFEPFFTTKEQGLGLGLSICRSIVEAHGGQLSASNNQDRGATFYLTLPVQEERPA